VATGPLGLAVVSAIFLFAVVTVQTAGAATEEDVAPQQALMFDMASFSPDQSLWSDKARVKFERVKNDGTAPLAVIKIDRLNIEGPIFDGTDKVTLDRGIGLVDGTAMPGEIGNMALSAHRDSFFRPLKDVVVGDRIELRTQNGIQDFEVSEITIVDSQDISVLDPTDTTVLTLITCYPFYYVGYAPDRFIVRAIPVES
jgi:sortase A